MQALAGLAHPPLFSPAVVPAHRGMVVEVPLTLAAMPGAAHHDALRDALKAFYAGSPLVRVLDGVPDELLLRQSDAPRDGLDLHVFGSKDGAQVRLIAALDNLGKGASGAAVQSLDLMSGLEETAGLRLLMWPKPDPVLPGQESAWAYPRPAIAQICTARIVIEHAGQIIADTQGSVRTLETSHPPSYYIRPPISRLVCCAARRAPRCANGRARRPIGMLWWAMWSCRTSAGAIRAQRRNLRFCAISWRSTLRRSIGAAWTARRWCRSRANFMVGGSPAR